MPSKDPRAGNAFVENESPPEPEKKELQVFSGVGSVRKKEKTGFAKWFSEMFLSGRSWKDVALDVLNNQIVPEVKDSLFNAGVEIARGRFYKDASPGTYNSYSGAQSGSFITRYIDYGKKSAQAAATKNAQTQAALEANQEKEKETVQAGYDVPTFPDRANAVAFLNSMKAEVSRYKEMSVHDLWWKRGKHISYTWDAYGWNEAEIMAIREPSRLPKPIIVEDGSGRKIKHTYYIDLPPSHPLNE